MGRANKERLPAQADDVKHAARFVAWLHETGIGGRVDLPRLLILYAEYIEAAGEMRSLSEATMTGCFKVLRLAKGSRDLLTESTRSDRSKLSYDDRIAMALWRLRAKATPHNHARPRVTWYDVGVPFTMASAA